MIRCPECGDRTQLERGCIGEDCSWYALDCGSDDCLFCMGCGETAIDNDGELDDKDVMVGDFFEDLQDVYDCDGYVLEDNIEWVPDD